MGFLNPLTWFADITFSGLGHALWHAVWIWGSGVGVIILLCAAAYLSPINKQYFLAAAAVVAIALFIFGYGQKSEKTICDARVKYIYLRAHPKVNPKTAAAIWAHKVVAPPVAASNGVTNANGLPCSVFGGC
jgi:hypothetical protein